MPKAKTHSGASKRFRKTGTGKIVRQKAGRRHLLEHKATKRTRRLDGHQQKPRRRVEHVGQAGLGCGAHRDQADGRHRVRQRLRCLVGDDVDRRRT